MAGGRRACSTSPHCSRCRASGEAARRSAGPCLAIDRRTSGACKAAASPAEPFAACGSGYTTPL
ncbi:hypothetical protein DWF74_03325 [Pseudomonas protegens]|nr:hypothetical protein DWF74_03325 [Pseudomonas protegens]